VTQTLSRQPAAGALIPHCTCCNRFTQQRSACQLTPPPGPTHPDTHPRPALATPGRALLQAAAPVCGSSVPGGGAGASSFSLAFDAASGCFTVGAGTACDPASGHCCVGAAAPTPPTFAYMLIKPSGAGQTEVVTAVVRSTHHAARCISPGVLGSTPPTHQPCAAPVPLAVSPAESTPCATQADVKKIR
jgi:hypothetical protein